LSQHFLQRADAAQQQSLFAALFTALFYERFKACGHLILRAYLQSDFDRLFKPTQLSSIENPTAVCLRGK